MTEPATKEPITLHKHPPAAGRLETIRELLLRMNRVSIALAIFVATLVIIIQEIVSLRSMAASEYVSQARIVGSNCTAALSFGFPQEAENVLASLKSVHGVIEAQIFDAEGKLFAKYRNPTPMYDGGPESSKSILDLTEGEELPAPRFPPMPSSDSPPPGPPTDIPEVSGPRTGSGSLPTEMAYAKPAGPSARKFRLRIRIGFRTITILDPIALKGEHLGYVRLLYDVTPMVFRLIELIIGLILLEVLTVFLASFLFSRRLEAISQPMGALVNTMQAITNDKDYSRRVPVAGPAEVSSLAEGFNALLLTTDQWNREILTHRENLEHLVEMRTTQWQTANRDLQAELEERRRTERELRTKTEELARVSENLARSLEFEKHFVANISHEIRTPLSAIIGFSDFALKTSLTAKQYEYLSKIHTAGASLLGIIDDILDFSKIEAGKLSIEKVPFKLDDVIGDAVDIVSHKINDKGLDFSLEIDPELPFSFQGDPLRLRQVLINLLGNAAKFTDSGEIGLRIEQVRPDSDQWGQSHDSDGRTRVSFSVRDTGIGMTPAQIKGLFMPFTQADGSTTRRFGGTGLGLSISKRLIELMDGEIQVESHYGIGSTFSFTALLDRNTFGEETRKVIPKNLQGLHVLLIDERRKSRQPLLRTLRQLPIRIDVASSVSSGARLFQEAPSNDPIRLVILESKDFGSEQSGFIESVKHPSETGDTNPTTGRMFPKIQDEPQDAAVSGQDHGWPLLGPTGAVLEGTPALIAVSSVADQATRNRLAELGADDVLKSPVTGSAMFDSIVRLFAPAELGAVRSGEPAEEGGTLFSGFHALVAEDNDFNQELAKELLQGWGFRVEIAQTGQEAVEKITGNPQGAFDIVLMDLQMPELDGFEATRRIRQHPKGAGIPIIAMTANAFSEDRVRALEAGMDDHVPKPIDPSELRAKLSARLEKSTKSKKSPGGGTPEPPKDFPPIPGLDLVGALDRFNGNKGSYSKMLLRFLSRRVATEEGLRAALAARDFEKLRFLAHSLRGSSGNLGVTKVFERSRILDQPGSPRQDEAVERDLEDLLSSLAEVCNAIEAERERLSAFLPHDPATTSAASDTRNLRELLPLLQELRADLQDHRFEAASRLERVSKSWGARLAGYPSFGELSAAVARFAFPKALGKLEELVGLLETEAGRSHPATPPSQEK